MNKGDLVNEVAKVVGTKKDAQAAVDYIFDSIAKTLKKKGQVVIAGFGTAKEMVSAMVAGEDEQLMAMVRFMQGNGLDLALRSRNWEKFARLYNGPSYAANKYDVKLEVQYARFSSGSTPDLEVRTAQAALLLLGYPLGKIDGVIGKRTKDAIRGFQIASGMSVTSELTGDTYAALYQAAFG